MKAPLPVALNPGATVPSAFSSFLQKSTLTANETEALSPFITQDLRTRLSQALHPAPTTGAADRKAANSAVNLFLEAEMNANRFIEANIVAISRNSVKKGVGLIQA